VAMVQGQFTEEREICSRSSAYNNKNSMVLAKTNMKTNGLE
jgi:hypothetical protein